MRVILVKRNPQNVTQFGFSFLQHFSPKKMHCSRLQLIGNLSLCGEREKLWTNCSESDNLQFYITKGLKSANGQEGSLVASLNLPHRAHWFSKFLHNCCWPALFENWKLESFMGNNTSPGPNPTSINCTWSWTAPHVQLSEPGQQMLFLASSSWEVSGLTVPVT